MNAARQAVDRLKGLEREFRPFTIRVNKYTMHVRPDGPVLRFGTEDEATAFAQKVVNISPKARVEVYNRSVAIKQVRSNLPAPITIPVIWEG